MMNGTQTPTKEPGTHLLDITSVAKMCGCSARTVRRLADAGKIPLPLRIGRLIRWRRRDVLNWISEGCPHVRTPEGARP